MRETYRGHEIAFDTETEEWKCGSLALSDLSLKALKRTIDKASKERRRVSVPAIYFETSWHEIPVVKDCTIILLREGDRKADIKIDRKAGTTQVEIGNLYPLSARDEIAAVVEAETQMFAASKKSERLKDKLRPLSAKAIREIVARQADEATT